MLSLQPGTGSTFYFGEISKMLVIPKSLKYPIPEARGRNQADRSLKSQSLNRIGYR